MMEGWKEIKLKECISTLKGFAFKSSWYQTEGVPVVRVSNFTDNSISLEEIEYVSEEIAKKHSRYKLIEKDIVIQTVGSWQHNPASIVGKVINVPSELKGSLLNQNAVKVIPNNGIDKRYLYYCLKNDSFKHHVLGCAQGAANQASITLSSIGDFEFHLPPLPTQRKIASILSSYDDLIENNLQRIKLLEEMAQITYEEWFVRMKFPGHESVEWDEETGLPVGWEKVKLGDYIKFIKGKKVGELLDEQSEGTAKVLLLSALENGEFKFTKVGRHIQTKRGDIMMLMDGARSSFVFYSENGIIGSTMAKVKTNKIPSSLLFHFFTTNLESLVTNNTGAAIPHANKSFINIMPFDLPSDEILNLWNTRIDIINRKVWNLKDQNTYLKEARDILLPRLMTGMIEV